LLSMAESSAPRSRFVFTAGLLAKVRAAIYIWYA
jgi:hypothetical protein